MDILSIINKVYAERIKDDLTRFTSRLLAARAPGADVDAEAIELIEAMEALEKSLKTSRGILRDAEEDEMQENGTLWFESENYEAGLSRKARQPIITDDAALRAGHPELFEPQPDKLNRSALIKALKTGAHINGATLSNGGGMSLVIRGKKGKVA
ncbi:siphovirus Gp157 family protein [Novacetimonas hansenii]|uniref:siphovirus Gp157 family protein n=1 Tax=Novacetimonas hansenii TaxID=436 RepID=UPI0017856426|nr:siphovirus Gp157 family protein [Novacetimonas hansenii]QOF94259.1 siphovirus Gp157 family protein [Novacetimonas hansenii]